MKNNDIKSSEKIQFTGWRGALEKVLIKGIYTVDKKEPIKISPIGEISCTLIKN